MKKNKIKKFNPFTKEPKGVRRKNAFWGKTKSAEQDAGTEDSEDDFSSEEEEEVKPEEEEMEKRRKKGLSRFVKNAIKTGVNVAAKTKEGAIATGKTAYETGLNVASRTTQVLNPLNIVDSGMNAIGSIGHDISDKIERKRDLAIKIKKVNEDCNDHINTLKMVNANIDAELMHGMILTLLICC